MITYFWGVKKTSRDRTKHVWQSIGGVVVPLCGSKLSGVERDIEKTGHPPICGECAGTYAVMLQGRRPSLVVERD